MSADAESPAAWLHRFCENWIYAFLVAFALKHFLIEPFRIPSASMEPMMYGDPSILRGDLVVVDKLVSRFRPYQRFDVAVFQFPLPELEAPGDARPAFNDYGERIDHPLLAPLYGRNFVKRIVGMPGDEFYIADGNLYLRGSDGAFACARKPADVQAAVWTAIYRHGDQEGYLPWQGEGGAAATAEGGRLRIDLPAGGRAAFTQPVTNLYLKPGEFRVAAWTGQRRTQVKTLPDGTAVAQNAPELTGPLIKVPLALTRPQFAYEGRTGNAWDLDRWNITRLKSDDLDSWQTHGTEVNPLMGEPVADLRLAAAAAAVDGEVELALDLPGAGRLALRLASGAWSARLDDRVLAEGASPLGRTLAIAHVDDRAVVEVDGAEVAAAGMPRFDTARNRAAIAWSGRGRIDLAELRFDRDLHWSRRGFLLDMKAADANGRLLASLDSGYRGGALVAPVRAQVLGKPVEALTAAQQWAPVGDDPARPGRVPADAYLLLGDNSPHSWDGRNWGFVPAVNLRGRAVLRLFPPQRFGRVR